LAGAEGHESEAPKPGGVRERIELWSAVLLAAATVATAYSAYEATRWGGVQATAFTEAGANRTESAKARADGFALIGIDANLFTQWGVAVTENNKRLERGIVQRLFRDEFKPVFRAWLAQDPANNEGAAKNPFELDEPGLKYQPRPLVEAEQLEEKATAKFDEGKAANQTGDDYVLSTIFFASVLFFAGLSSKFTSSRVAMLGLSFATIVFLGGIVRLSTLPFF
jgi:hypothetical protein